MSLQDETFTLGVEEEFQLSKLKVIGTWSLPVYMNCYGRATVRHDNVKCIDVLDN